MAVEARFLEHLGGALSFGYLVQTTLALAAPPATFAVERHDREHCTVLNTSRACVSRSMAVIAPMLHEFVTVNREEIIRRCRAKVATRSDATPTTAEIDHGVPMFLDQLLDELRHGPSADSDITKTATQHGHDLLMQGYTVSQVVHDYGDVCQTLTELAVERHSEISAGDFRTLNRCLDDAIAGAVTEFGRESPRSSERDDTIASSRRETMTRDLLKALHISKFAFDAIRSGSVGVAGSTGTVLSLGLDTASDLAERLLAESMPPAAPPPQLARPSRLLNKPAT